ncbi:MAG TPA: beta-ketoacyl-ACP synthase III [Nitrospinota bacterium]|nr:beta-ketoacyl-ACP synthase III [Nitrospinota bacterium]
MIRSKIVGVGSYLPKKVLTNFDLEKLLNTSDEWIRTRTGVIERRIAGEDEATSDLGYKAAIQAIEDAKITPNDIDLILVATTTPDTYLPSSACYIQNSLGINRGAALDISAACAGFIFALSIADQYIRAGTFKNILVIGSEVLSRITDWTDRNTCVLFGDGAGAVVVQASDSEDSGILSTHIHSDGTYKDYLIVPGGGSRKPLSNEVIDKKLNYIKMKGNETFKIAVTSMVNVAKEALDANGYKSSELDLLITHQANKRIIDAIAKRLKLPKEKVYINLEKYGNTSAASIPIALDEAKREGLLKEGSLILLVGLGAGFAWGSVLVKM